MSFAYTLARLREAATQGQRGMPPGEVVVRRRDLLELLDDFDRLDAEVRRRDWTQELRERNAPDIEE